MTLSRRLVYDCVSRTKSLTPDELVRMFECLEPWNAPLRLGKNQCWEIETSPEDPASQVWRHRLWVKSEVTT